MVIEFISNILSTLSYLFFPLPAFLMSTELSSEEVAAFNQEVNKKLSQPDSCMLVDLRGVEEIENAKNAVRGN